MSKEVTIPPEVAALGEDLTSLQRMTVINVVSGKMSNRAAYYAAGGKAKSPEVADAVVARLLGMAKVKAYYDALLGCMEKTAIMTREEALEMLSRMARTTVKDVASFRSAQVGEDENGSPVYQTVWEFVDDGDLAEEHAPAIQEIGAGPQGLKFKLHSQAQAIKQLADMEGWNAPRKTELTGKDGKPLAIAATVDVSAPEIAEALQEILKRL